MKKRVFMFLIVGFLLTILTPFASALDIQAGSAFVMDGVTGEELYHLDGDSTRVPASMTKVRTAYIVYQELELAPLP